MSKVIEFRGGAGFKPGHAYATPPLVGPFKQRPLLDVYTGKPVTDDQGNPVLETIVGWEVGDQVTFDRSLAEQYGRLSRADDKDDGDEWAEFFLGTWNANFAKGEEPFQVVSKAKAKDSTQPVAVDAAGAK